MAIEMKNKHQFPKTVFFFDFSNPLKQIKNDLLNPKTLLKLVAKTLKKMRIFALQNCCMKPAQMRGIYSPKQILPVGSQERSEMTFRSTARSTGTG